MVCSETSSTDKFRESMSQKLASIQARIKLACERVNRRVDEVALVLVTKQVTTEQVQAAYEAGIRDFGENRVQEFVKKKEALPKDVRWHLIGNLQTNKVKFVVGETTLIHSCDRLELAKALDQKAAQIQKQVEMLIQVNTSGELTKHGFFPEELPKAVKEILKHKQLKIRGLMTIGPLTEDTEQIRRAFQSLRKVKERMQSEFPKTDWTYLSMGMTGDFEIAIEEGANLLRIGSAIFGKRKK